jgi:hypothetical protein
MSANEMRKSALRRFVVFRIKAMEFMDMNVTRDGLNSGTNNYGGHLRPPEFMGQSLRTPILSYFALFVDKKEGLNVIELWKTLFPTHRKRVEEVWTKIEPTWALIRDFRDSAGFHADKPTKFFRARYALKQDWLDIEKALKQFVALFNFFLHVESDGGLPDFETELDSLLDDLESKQSHHYNRKQFKQYLMIPVRQ